MTTQTKINSEQLVANLAWEFCEKSRKSEKPLGMAAYLRRLPDEESRAAFKELVNADLLLNLAVQERCAP